MIVSTDKPRGFLDRAKKEEAFLERTQILATGYTLFVCAKFDTIFVSVTTISCTIAVHLFLLKMRVENNGYKMYWKNNKLYLLLLASKSSKSLGALFGISVCSSFCSWSKSNQSYLQGIRWLRQCHHHPCTILHFHTLDISMQCLKALDF